MTLIATERECHYSYMPQVPIYKRVGTSETGQRPRALGFIAGGARFAAGRAGPILVGDGRVAAGVSEMGPARPDGEPGVRTNYSRPWPTIIRDCSRRPRRGRAHAPDYGAPATGPRPPCEAD